MSSEDDEDITRIEDLPDFNPEDEDEDFASLEDMASDMGLEVSSLYHGVDEPPETPPQLEATTFSEEFTDEFDDENPPEFTTEFDSQDAEEEGSWDKWDENNQTNDFPPEDEITSVDDPFGQEDQSAFSEPEPEPEPEQPSHAEKTERIESAARLEELRAARARREQEELSTKMIELETLTPQETSPEPVIKTQINREEETPYSPPEALEEIEDFAQSHAIMDYPAEGNPPFSIIIKNLKYYEDVDQTLQILEEFKLLEDRESEKQKLINGQMLIPRLSEYVAILLCHKLRAIDCDLLMGLTEELRPAKSYKSDDRGLMTKHGLKRNRQHHYTLSDLADNRTIMATTLNLIEGYSIVEHLGIVTETKNLTSEELRPGRIEEEIIDRLEDQDSEKIQNERIKYENTLASQSQKLDFSHISSAHSSKPHHFQLDSIYRDMVEDLKSKAVDRKANAVLGINFTITPVSIESYLNSGPEYQILCTGNLVWLEKN